MIDLPSEHLAMERRRHAYDSEERRARNYANGECINQTLAGTHGPRTSGVLCADCRAKHRGHDLEREFGRDAYLAMRKQAHRENRPLLEIAAERRER